jgi:Tfp pilus assembly protein PilF
MKHLMKTLFLFFSLLLAATAKASADKNISAVNLNNQAVQEILKDTLPAAQGHLIQALGKSPENSSVHLNLGFVLEKDNKPEKAQASYEQALKMAKSPTEKFNALFNLGQLSQKGKKTDEALTYYQQALNENPESKETKINIELLMKQQDQQKDKKGDKGDKDDKKNQQNMDQNKDQGKDQNKDRKDQDKDGKDKKDQPKQYGKQPQPKPQFKSDQLNQADVNKILGELKQQEQRIRAEYNRKEVKERPNDKDW